MAWLLNSKTTHMRNLARDIVENQGLFEPPLVYPDGESFTVADGNRRVTCLKLLRDPSLAPTVDLEAYFRHLGRGWTPRTPISIECQVEADRDRVDEILYRRHTGSQGGIGQSPWDDRAKHNFVERTGKKTRIDPAIAVSTILHRAGYNTEAAKLPRSNLNRLLSSEAVRGRLGFTMADGEFKLLRREDAVVRALLRVAQDLISRKIVLGDLWDADGKREYLNHLELEGVLPTNAPLPDEPWRDGPSVPDPDDEPPAEPQPPWKPAPPLKRTSLIPQDLPYAVTWSGETARLKDIWDELQHKLVLTEQPNAIGVLFRVLLDLSVAHYIATHTVQIRENDNLAMKVDKAAAHMRLAGLMDAKHQTELRKFGQSEHIVSAHTMNAYVHSLRFSPSPEHLAAMWNALSSFIVKCLNA